MIGSVLSVIAAINGQAATPTSPKVDRSGEAAFRKLLQEIAELKPYHGMILRSNREASSPEFYPGGIIELWQDGGKFRIEFNDMWGTSQKVVSDGKRILDDPGADPIVIRKPGKSLVEASPSLANRGQASSPWFYLIEGPGLLDRIDRDREITLDPNSGGINWNSTLFGRLRLTASRTDSGMRSYEIVFDNIAWQQEMFKLYPEWFRI